MQTQTSSPMSDQLEIIKKAMEKAKKEKKRKGYQGKQDKQKERDNSSATIGANSTQATEGQKKK